MKILESFQGNVSIFGGFKCLSRQETGPEREREKEGGEGERGKEGGRGGRKREKERKRSVERCARKYAGKLV